MNVLALANHRVSIRMTISSRPETAAALTSAALALTDWLVDETPRVAARCMQTDAGTDQDDAVA